jgi:hypothetical protein
MLEIVVQRLACEIDSRLARQRLTQETAEALAMLARAASERSIHVSRDVSHRVLRSPQGLRFQRRPVLLRRPFPSP